MPRFKVADVDELAPGKVKLLSMAGMSLALFNIDGCFYAIRNRCPHEGGPVATGPLEGRVVTCPWHGWQFDVTTGQSPNYPAFTVKTYSVVVKDASLYVEFSDGS